MKVKLKLIFLFSVLFISAALLAQSQVELAFDKASLQYKSKEFNKALANFLSIENEGIANADLFYNIGNCFLRTNEIGKSVLYYKKALKVDSNHKQSRRNLQYVLTLTKDKQNSSDDSVIRSFWKKIFDSLSLNFLATAILLIFVIIIIVICSIILYYQESEKTIPLFIVTILSVIFVLLLMITVVKYQEYTNEQEAVLIAKSVIGYSGPSTDFTRVFTIHEGISFAVEKEQDGWSLIKLSNGLGGWIKSKTFKKVSI